MTQSGSIVRRYPSTDFVTGLRAVAALMVIVIHTGAFRDFGWVGGNVTDAGKGGVQIFFVLSGFSIAHAFAADPHYGRFLMRRFLRIAPAYYVVLAITCGLILSGAIAAPVWMERFGGQLDVRNIAMHVTFLSFTDLGTAATIIGVEWTLPIEMFWYLVLPVVLGPRMGVAALVGFALFSVGLAEAAKLAYAAWGGADGRALASWSPFLYGSYFAAGLVAYRVRAFGSSIPSRMGRAGFAAGCAVFVAAVFGGLGNESVLMGYSTALIVAFMPDDDNPVRRALEARAMLLLGTFSYGLYLVHFVFVAILTSVVGDYGTWAGLIRFGAVLALSLAASYALFHLVERPANGFGRRVSTRWARQAEAARSG